jgi:hypothetical protein
MSSVLSPAASVWAVAERVCSLDANGYCDPGADTYTIEQMMKLTMTPVVATGDDIEQKNAAGNLGVFAKHGDIPKYATIALEAAEPDPILEQLCCGGVLLSSTASALGTPTGLTVTPQITLGKLKAGTYGYRASVYNAFGETIAENSVAATIASGEAGTNVISAVAMPEGAYGVRVYGRHFGVEQYLGSYNNIGEQKTKAASGTGTVEKLTVSALTKSIPIGTKFQIAGDTNTTKIVFTTTAFGALNETELLVEGSQSVTTTIAEGALVPVFVDTGVVTPSGNLPSTDTTAGPGENVGYQAPELGVVANPNGVSIEVWSKAIKDGTQAAENPFFWWALPKVANMRIMPRDLTNANTQTIMEGQAFQNPHWGKGPFGTFPFDSTKWVQRFRCGEQVVPEPSNEIVPATA